MTFNIEMIFEQLDIADSTLISKHKTDFLLEGVKLYREDQTIESQYLYILTSNQLKRLSPTVVSSFVCIGTWNRTTDISSYLSIIVVPPKTDVHLLLEKITNVFDSFRSWERQAYTLILKKKPLQDVLDYCSAKLKNPLALFDSQQALILKSGSIPLQNADSIWKHVLKTGESPQEEHSSYLAEKLHSSKYPFLYNSDNQYKNINRMIVRVTKNALPFGCLSMTDVSVAFSATEYSILFYTACITELYLTNSEEFTSYNSDTPWFLTQLFQGISLDSDTIQYNAALLGMRQNTPFQLWIFHSLKNIDLYQNGGHMRHIKQIFKSPFAYVYQNQIIILVLNPTLALEDQKESLLLSLLTEREFKCAYSLIYHSFTDIHAAYSQCQTLLATFTLESDLYLNFHTCYLSLIKKHCQQNSIPAIMLYPNTQAILSNSKDNYGVELLTCLKAYIINGQNVSTTAKKLSIHRHTVIYRLERISEILKIEFRGLDETTLIQLYMSCLLLLD
ncbi:MAG TPA: helix-turn-helix domain-containing protein [Candidatus Merdenecus merdavium]|nr:helix-turn-helix domain-containing protein [Candidatus Merdenecus merdavium]